MKNTASRIYQEFIGSLLQADSFRNNWYGYATNQISHFTLGFLFSAVVSFIGYSILGDFCKKEVILGIVAFCYLIVEISQFRTSAILDSIEDTVFFVVYGAGASVLLFDQLADNSSKVVADINSIIPVATIIGCHILAGSFARVCGKIKNDGASDD